MKTFNITVEMLKSKGACMGGMRDFLERYPKEQYPDGVDYQELLDACAANDRDEYGSWLLSAIGRTSAVLEMDEIDSEKSIFFSGSIRCKGAIKCARGINAGSGIKAGLDYGIHAGLRVCMSEKSKYATSKAKHEPRNIVCGTFVKVDGDDNA